MELSMRVTRTERRVEQADHITAGATVAAACRGASGFLAMWGLLPSILAFRRGLS